MIVTGNLMMAMGVSELYRMGVDATYLSVPTATVSALAWLFLIAASFAVEGAELPKVTPPRIHMPRIAFPRMRFSWPKFGRKRKRSYAFNAEAMGSVKSLDDLFV